MPKKDIIRSAVLAEMRRRDLTPHGLFKLLKRPPCGQRMFYLWLDGEKDLGVAKAEQVAVQLGLRIEVG